MQIHSLDIKDYPSVRDFYYELIDAMQEDEFRPGWEKDVYPNPELLQTALRRGELYAAEQQGKIVACMVVNHEYNEGYKQIRWGLEAKDSELLVIHALGVDHSLAGRGIAKQMVGKVFELAGEQGVKTLRLDVLEGNIPAEKAYTKMGFEYLDTISMFYEDTGWTNFRVFECIL